MMPAVARLATLLQLFLPLFPLPFSSDFVFRSVARFFFLVHDHLLHRVDSTCCELWPLSTTMVMLT
jgi:hypothetical protein